MVGTTGYYSQNNSLQPSPCQQLPRLFSDEDHRYRIKAVVLRGDLNYDFSGIGTDAGITSGQSIPLQKQKMTGGIFETLFQVAPNFYVGPKYVGSRMNFDVGSHTTILSSQFPPTR